MGIPEQPLVGGSGRAQRRPDHAGHDDPGQAYFGDDDLVPGSARTA